MKITETVTHAADPQRVFEMLCDHDYQVARCQRAGALDQTVTIDRQTDGTAVATTQRHLPSDGIPDLAKPFIGPRLLLVETVRWGVADADGEREGAMGIELPGVPVSFTGGVHLRRGPGDGTTMHRVDGDLEVNIPFLRQRIGKLVSERIREMMLVEGQVAEEWLRAHPTG